MYPCIGFFRKLPYPRIRILPIPIRVSVSVLHRWQLQQHCSCNQVPTISYNNKHVAANLSSEFSVSYGCNACLILTVLVKMQPQN